MLAAIQKEQFFQKIKQGNTTQVLELLAIEPELLRQINRLGDTPIELAAYNQHWELIKAVAEQYPADQNDSQQYAYALLEALIAKQWETAIALINANAFLDYEDEHSNNVLHHAMQAGQTELTLAILEKAPELLSQTNRNDNTPIMLAINNNHWELIKAIAEQYPADENDSQQYGLALRRAVKAKQWETAMALKPAPATPSVATKMMQFGIHQQTTIPDKVLKINASNDEPAAEPCCLRPI